MTIRPDDGSHRLKQTKLTDLWSPAMLSVPRGRCHPLPAVRHARLDRVRGFDWYTLHSVRVTTRLTRHTKKNTAVWLTFLLCFFSANATVILALVCRGVARLGLLSCRRIRILTFYPIMAKYQRSHLVKAFTLSCEPSILRSWIGTRWYDASRPIDAIAACLGLHVIVTTTSRRGRHSTLNDEGTASAQTRKRWI